MAVGSIAHESFLARTSIRSLSVCALGIFVACILTSAFINIHTNLAMVSIISFVALTGETAKVVVACCLGRAVMSATFAFINVFADAFRVHFVSVFTITFITAFRVATSGAFRTFVLSQFALVDVEAFSTVSDPTLRTFAFIRPLEVFANRHVGAFIRSVFAFVDFFAVSEQAISFVSIFADTFRLSGLLVFVAMSIFIARIFFVAALVERLAKVSVSVKTGMTFAFKAWSGIYTVRVGVTFVSLVSTFVGIGTFESISYKAVFAQTVI